MTHLFEYSPQDNSQNIFILLIIAVITGFVLPAITKAFEIVFTRQVDRKTEIRNKQLEIVEQLTKYIWEWRFLGKQVCYYGYHYKINRDRFRLAIKNYNERVWSIFTEIKALKSRSIVWFPELVSEEIEKLYEYIKSEVDAPMTELMENSENEELDLTKDFYNFQLFFTEEVSSGIEMHIKIIADKINKSSS
jgi:hypothetical protein